MCTHILTYVYPHGKMYLQVKQHNNLTTTNNLIRTVQYLQKIYNLINQEYFNNELEEITLTVQESVRSYGHVSVSNTWFITS